MSRPPRDNPSYFAGAAIAMGLLLLASMVLRIFTAAFDQPPGGASAASPLAAVHLVHAPAVEADRSTPIHGDAR